VLEADDKASSGLLGGWWPIAGCAFVSAIALVWLTTSTFGLSNEGVVRKLLWSATAGLGLIVFLSSSRGWAINFGGCGGE
jgi:hypothetical protein